MKLKEIEVLVLPGWQNSDSDHWQTLFENEFRGSRVDQKDWLAPKCKDWIEALNGRISKLSRPGLMIAHSLGCHLAVKWANTHQGNIAGVFLVSPPDLERDDTPSEIIDFRPTPLIKLPFPSLVVGTSTDPYISLDRLEFFAKKWGSKFHHSQSTGHINVASGNGPWPEGERLFKDFVELL